MQPDENARLRELVKMRIRGAELETDEEKELYQLHRKGNRGIGATTPGQLTRLIQLQEEDNSGQPLTPASEKQLEFLTELSAQPSQLNELQEQELGEME